MGCSSSKPSTEELEILGQSSMSRLTLEKLRDMSTGDLNCRDLDERQMRISAFQMGQTWPEYLEANGNFSQISGKFTGIVPWPGNEPYPVEIVVEESRLKPVKVNYPMLKKTGEAIFTNATADGTVTYHYDETGPPELHITYGTPTDLPATDLPADSAEQAVKISLTLLETGDVTYVYGDIAAGRTATLTKMLLPLAK
jgi:hypothetical protein